jgi:hypothetical protein
LRIASVFSSHCPPYRSQRRTGRLPGFERCHETARRCLDRHRAPVVGQPVATLGLAGWYRYKCKRISTSTGQA